MTHNADFKTLVRQEMIGAGLKYTEARRVVLARSPVFCGQCNERLPERTDQNLRPPCPHCGSTRRIFEVSGGAVGKASAGGSASLTFSNAWWVKRREFSEAVARTAEAIATGDLAATQRRVKDVLAVLDELEDRRANKDWSYEAWNGADQQLWLAHLPARHAGHHHADSIVALESTVVWDVQPETLDKLQTSKHNGLYKRILHGNAVLDGLQRLDSLLP